MSSGVAKFSFPRLKSKMLYLGSVGRSCWFLSLGVVLPGAMAVPPGAFGHRIAVDQFGYLPDMVKVAVISDPQRGFNAPGHYTPGKSLEVRTWSNNMVVFVGAPVAWNNGQTHEQSGDRVWWFDFSPLTNQGEFYVYDPDNDTRSARFRIADNVYREVLKQAVRVFYYQRRGAAKSVPYAAARWADGTNFLGPLQDAHCRLITHPAAATERDLRGGWFDAGDYNKYVYFTLGPISELLFAYEQNPSIWPDNWSLPESGNGIPDLLDEVKWELDWLLRMQNANGSVLSKMGVNQFQDASPPSAEKSQVFYGAESTAATLTAAGHFAHAARIYTSIGQTAYANVLSKAAVTAYNWAAANPSMAFSNTGFASADPEKYIRANYAYEWESLRTRAAIFLYALTHQPAYRVYVESACTRLQALSQHSWDVYQTPVQDALLYFTTLPGVTPAVASRIREAKQASIDGDEFMGAWTSRRDAYRAFVIDGCYHWGNNQFKGRSGQLFAQQNTYGLNPGQAADYREAAAGYLHYLHGVNPLTLVYLSNMYDYGAECCVNEIYHSWFGHGTVYQDALLSLKGPPPGYVTGGANQYYHPAAVYAGPRLAPPLDQPPQKSYKDWNVGWPEDSWELTEPAIYYQSAYVFLLSRFVPPWQPVK